MAFVNRRTVRAKALGGADKIITRSQSKFDAAKDRAFRRFKDKVYKHPVTREILGGPSAENITGTLGGYGNLFSFIGFEESNDNPIKPIVDYIGDKIAPHVTIKHPPKSSVWTITIKIPTLEELGPLAPMPWAPGRNWLKGVERGMSGFGSYMYEQDGVLEEYDSRSGTAIQIKNKITAGNFKNTKYMSSLLNFFADALKEEMRRVKF